MTAAGRRSEGGLGRWLDVPAAWSRDAAAGLALLVATLGWISGLPGTGPQSASAAAWAPFARAVTLMAPPVTLGALLLTALAATVGGRRRLGRALVVLALLAVVVTVLASALFSPWGGINLQEGGGGQQATVATLGGLGDRALRWLPALLFRLAALILAVALPAIGRRASIWGSLLFGAGVGLLACAPVLGTAGLGGALFAAEVQRLRAAVVGVCVAAAGIAAQLRASAAAGDRDYA